MEGYQRLMRHLKSFYGLALAASIILMSTSVPARAQKAISAHDILDLHKVSDIQLSPDGKQAAIVLNLPGNGVSDKEAGNRIWIRQTRQTGNLHLLEAGVQGDNSPRWSPDGRYLAFLSSRPVSEPSSSGDSQIFVVPSTGGAAKRITHIPGGVSWFAWSPDSSMIAFLAPDTPNSGPAGDSSSPILIDQSFTPARLWVVNVATGQSTVALKLPADIEDFAWAPDSQRFAVLCDSAPTHDGISSTTLMVADRQSGRILRTFDVNPEDSSQVLRWSPDGRLIAFQQKAPGVNTSWWAVVRAEGGDPHPLLKDYVGNILQLEFAEDSHHVFLEMAEGTRQALVSLSTTDDSVERIAEVNAPTFDFAFSTNGRRLLYLSQTTTTPSNVWTLEPRETPVALTDLNPQTSAWAMGAVSEVNWINPQDGLALHGILIKPVGFDDRKHYPMVVLMHPGDMPWWDGFHASWWDWGQLLASRGFVVFMPNYRGVNGQGWKLAARLGDWGVGLAFQDMMEGVDRIIRQGFVDSERLGIGGWSNGGFMTEWVITHTQRFKAAVAEAGMADFFAMYSAPGGDRQGWRANFGASPYEARSAYDVHSPITYVRACRTPTLLLHGQQDRSVPVGQAYEFHTALQDLGIDTNLVIYPNEGHTITNRNNRLDVQNRVVAWFTKYLR
jgi:dipeptidyl aminopeptidase/acylaminoacyl peptidase